MREPEPPFVNAFPESLTDTANVELAQNFAHVFIDSNRRQLAGLALGHFSESFEEPLDDASGVMSG